jgi:ribonuclease HI
MDVVLGQNLASSLDNTLQHSRQKYMPLRHVQQIIQRGAIKNRNIHIPSDSQEAIKALENYQIDFKWVWDCHQSHVKLTEHNRVQLVRVPGYRGITDNGTANHWARMGS